METNYRIDLTKSAFSSRFLLHEQRDIEAESKEEACDKVKEIEDGRLEDWHISRIRKAPKREVQDAY